MTHAENFVNGEKDVFRTFPQLFGAFDFNGLRERRGESVVHKSAPGISVSVPLTRI
ncbi:MAG TPA: hypothetical protein VFC21_12510 [Bryobacteraceae bacterium]|nr:hypothetical protein [Bryobacteraceae bacterium]